MKSEELRRRLSDSEFDRKLRSIYGCDEADAHGQAMRLSRAVESFERLYGLGRDVEIFSAPGRTEIGGNHTDHQGGRVLAAAVNLDAVAVASKTEDGVIRVKSEGFPEDVVETSNLQPVSSERGTSAALIRGVAAGFEEQGCRVGSFCAYTTSDVLSGSGLSSSAAFEVLIGTIFNSFYFAGKAEPLTVAQIARRAENNWFGKPCGLMDQAASVLGGFTMLDFKDGAHPSAEQISFDFSSCGYTLCMIDTKGSHSDLTPDYAAIPEEMIETAGFFGKETLCEVEESDFFASIASLRSEVGDRAVLRAVHYFEENARVLRQAGALRKKRFGDFKKMVIESGFSSFMYLQNVYSPSHIREQGVALALALCERLLRSRDGAWRVHGGGFAGTVQAYVPDDFLTEFTGEMEAVFGKGACRALTVRQPGGIKML